MKKVNKESFFDLRSRFISSTFQAHPIGLEKDASGTDAHWNLIKGKYEDIKFPIVFKQKYGKNLTDVLDTGWPSLYLISNKFKDVLESNWLNGWQTFVIKLYDKRGNEISGYHGFSILGKSSSISYENSEIIEKRLVPDGPICKFYKGMDINEWDGSDFFTPEGTYEILVTIKAARILKESSLTNLELINLMDVEVDTDCNF